MYRSFADMEWPSVAIVGAGAAGLWCTMRLLERGFPGDRLTLIEPEAKDADDRTWSFWTHEDIVPRELIDVEFEQIELAANGKRALFDTRPYRYQSLRSAKFYAFAKTRLASAKVSWVSGSVIQLAESPQTVQLTVLTSEGSSLLVSADYVLDSRLPALSVPGLEHNVQLLQPFGGWYIETDQDHFDPKVMTFMDFNSSSSELEFFYAIPHGPRRALVEIAAFCATVPEQAYFDKALEHYISDRLKLSPAVAALEFEGRTDRGLGEPSGRRSQNPEEASFGASPIEGSFGACRGTPNGDAQQKLDPDSEPTYRITGREYGVIPMSDRPFWRDSTARVWKIGTAAGWVQPSSGYAFTRIARFAGEVAEALAQPKPKAWQPKPVQQVFNSVMLGHLRDHPATGGRTFVNLFEQAGAAATFAFLDERATLWQTLQVMNASPRASFIRRSIAEVLARVRGRK